MAYFSNGTEGDHFEMQCAECPIGEKNCPIALVQLIYNYEQCDNSKLKGAMDLLVNESGDCQLKPILDAES